jgi:hypothetical protein
LELLSLLLIVSSTGNMAAEIPLAQQPTFFSPSVLEPFAPPLAPEEPQSWNSTEQANIPSLVASETPEIEALASWQASYLWLIGDEGKALSGFYDPFTFQFAYGQNGYQPYRLGWYSYNDFVLMSRSPATIGGNFQDVQWNAWVRYAHLYQTSPIVFSWTGWMNGKFWTGPTGINLPPGAAQFISDFQWASANVGPWNWQIGFAPQLNGTFNDRINANALMCDVRAVLLWRASPEWVMACGAAFWNRAADHLIPYGGAIWTPDDRWEFRFMFPRSRASYYVGRYRGADAWLYASGEYNLDGYQIDIEGPRDSTRAEISDYRVLLGSSATTGIWTMFVEAGLVTDRRFRFRGPAPSFMLDDCAILRTGLLF